MLKFQKDIVNVLQFQHWFDSQNRNKAQQWFSLLPWRLGINAGWEGISVLKSDKSVWKCISRFTFWARVPLYSYSEVSPQTCSDRLVALWRGCAMPSCKSTLMHKSAWKSEIWKIAMTNPVQTHGNLTGKKTTHPCQMSTLGSA